MTLIILLLGQLQLRTKFDQLGLLLNITVPRTALKQIYDQMIKTSNNAGLSDNRNLVQQIEFREVPPGNLVIIERQQTW